MARSDEDHRKAEAHLKSMGFVPAYVGSRLSIRVDQANDKQFADFLQTTTLFSAKASLVWP